MATDGKFELLAMLVASGRTVASSADELGVSRRTAYRNTQKPAFQRRVSEIRQEFTAGCVGKLTTAASRAADTLTELLDSDYDASIRLQASKAILTALGPMTELAELRERVARLEGQSVS
jgi:hypothetical protein